MNFRSLSFLFLSASLSLCACSSTTTPAYGDGGPGKDGSSGKDAAPSDPFVGKWSCASMATTTFTAPKGTPAKTTNTTASVVNSDDGKGNITSLHTPEGDGAAPPCTFHLKLGADGRSATSVSATCTAASGGMLTYTTNDWTLKSSSSYDTSFAYDFSGKTMTGAPLTGMGTGMGTCTKM